MTEELEAIRLAEEALARRGILGNYVRRDVRASEGFWVINYDYADETRRSERFRADMTILVSQWTGKVQIYDEKVKGQLRPAPSE